MSSSIAQFRVPFAQNLSTKHPASHLLRRSHVGACCIPMRALRGARLGMRTKCFFSITPEVKKLEAGLPTQKKEEAGLMSNYKLFIEHPRLELEANRRCKEVRERPDLRQKIEALSVDAEGVDCYDVELEQRFKELNKELDDAFDDAYNAALETLGLEDPVHGKSSTLPESDHDPWLDYFAATIRLSDRVHFLKREMDMV